MITINTHYDLIQLAHKQCKEAIYNAIAMRRRFTFYSYIANNQHECIRAFRSM